MNAALKIAQERWDSLLPEDYCAEDDDSEFVAEQVDKLLDCQDSHSVPFFDKRVGSSTGSESMVYGFAGFVPEWLAEVDGSECPMAQLLLAVRRGDFELAQDIWFDRFESTLIGNAWKLVRQGI